MYGVGKSGKFHEYLNLAKTIKPPIIILKKISEFFKKIKPDILALIEIDHGSPRTFSQSQVTIFKKALQLSFDSSEVKYQKKSFSRLLHKIPLVNQQGNAVISRYNLSSEPFHLKNGLKSLVLVTKVNYTKPFILIVVHLAIVKPTRDAQVKELNQFVKNIKGPLILVGDFNDEKITFPTLNKISTPPTFPAYKPKKKLDLIFTSNHFNINKVSIDPILLSDHLPLIIDFEVN
jgi:endonuclease/exonuclease/phosphatase family metal-dependent hydrolase